MLRVLTELKEQVADWCPELWPWRAKEEVQHTKMASISFSVTGVLFGCREALPPTAVLIGGAGTSDLEE